MDPTTPIAGRERSRQNLRPAWTSETAREASLSAASKAARRTRTRIDAAQIEKDARAYLVSVLPQAIRALVAQALENPDGAAMGRLLERALPLLQDQGAGRKVLEGLTLEISRDGVKLQLPSAPEVTPLPPVDVQTEPISNSLSSKGLGTSVLPAE